MKTLEELIYFWLEMCVLGFCFFCVGLLLLVGDDYLTWKQAWDCFLLGFPQLPELWTLTLAVIVCGTLIESWES